MPGDSAAFQALSCRVVGTFPTDRSCGVLRGGSHGAVAGTPTLVTPATFRMPKRWGSGISSRPALGARSNGDPAAAESDDATLFGNGGNRLELFLYRNRTLAGTFAGLGFALTVATALADVRELATPPAVSFSQEILNAHNKYRAAVGVPPLVWSDGLAAAARAWADTLNSNLQFAHDPETQNQGENLWMGTAGAFSLTQMVESWGQEKRNFQNGAFPNVSTTGNWFDVGHYTQMVWRNTTAVGCAGVSGSDGNYRLVCRYSTPGNVMGERAF